MRGHRLFVAGIFCAALAAFVLLDAAQWLSLERLQRTHSLLRQAYADTPWRTLGVFFGGYVLLCALALPGTMVLTIAAGFLFDFWMGLALVSFASTLGATLAFALSRLMFRDLVQNRWAAQLRAINAGMVRDGAWYLLTLRLIPLFPYFMVNLAMGLTPIKVWTFAWVSQIGMLAGSAIYVSAGTQLSRVSSIGDVLNPALMGALVLLGLLPWIARGSLPQLRNWLTRRRLYRAWRGARPRRFDRNLVVIGAGAGGLVSAYIAAAVRSHVTLIEANRMGGECLNSGCVPSKALIHCASVAYTVQRAPLFGVSVQNSTIDFAAVMRHVQQAIAQIAPHDSTQRYSDLGVEVLHGHATLINPWTVQVAGQRLTTRAIVIATGATPTIPPIEGLGNVAYLTSDTVWEAFAQLPSPPRRLLVLGGGPIGCELAQAFARLGCAVTLLEAAPRLLPHEDEEVSTFACERLRADGVTVHLNAKTRRIDTSGTNRVLTLQTPPGETHVEFEHLLVAVGRTPTVTGLGLEALGITAAKTVDTNAYLQTLYPNIYAVGDVAGPYQLTHAAAHQAWFATVNALFGQWKKFKATYTALPRVIFMAPEIARVGLNEQEARAQAVAYELTRYRLSELDRAIVHAQTDGFIKVLTPPGSDRILGVTIVGEHAGEMLSEFVLAIRHGIGLNRILGTVHAYPTWAEANKAAAGAWKLANQPQTLLRLMQRYHRWRLG